jgi:hypothetical protein
MKKPEKLIMALHKNNYNLQRFSPPEIEPPVFYILLLLRERCSGGNGSSERTERRTPPLPSNR